MRPSVWHLAVALPLIALLSGCGGEPSESEMQEAVQKKMKTPLGMLEIEKFEKIGCKEATDKEGYVCDYKMTIKGNTLLGMMAGSADNTGSGRFVKSKDGWELFVK